MKKYTLEVIMNVSQKLKTYEVIADYFDWSESGCYVFYTLLNHSQETCGLTTKEAKSQSSKTIMRKTESDLFKKYPAIS